MRRSIAIVAISSGLASCGQDKGEPVERDYTPGQAIVAGAALTDSDVANETINDQVDEAVEASLDGVATSKGITLTLWDDDLTLDDQKSKSCVPQADGSAVVTIATTKAKDLDRTHKHKTVKKTVNQQRNESRTFRQNAATLSCNADLDGLKYPADVTGLTLKSVVKRVRTGEEKTTRLDQEKKETLRIREESLNGQREVAFIKRELGIDGSLSIERVVKLNTTREEKLTINGEVTKSFTIETKTKDEAPLRISLFRPREHEEWTKKTITSGTVVSGLKAGGFIEATFREVAFADGACTPVSGKVEGRVLSSDGLTVEKTYVIDFGTTPATITYEDKSTADFANDGCAFEVD